MLIRHWIKADWNCMAKVILAQIIATASLLFAIKWTGPSPLWIHHNVYIAPPRKMVSGLSEPVHAAWSWDWGRTWWIRKCGTGQSNKISRHWELEFATEPTFSESWLHKTLFERPDLLNYLLTLEELVKKHQRFHGRCILRLIQTWSSSSMPLRRSPPIE